MEKQETTSLQAFLLKELYTLHCSARMCPSIWIILYCKSDMWPKATLLNIFCDPYNTLRMLNELC